MENEFLNLARRGNWGRIGTEGAELMPQDLGVPAAGATLLSAADGPAAAGV
jgi:hypothetical protein